MPVSWVSICNGAVMRLGLAELITGFDSTNKITVLCKNNWESARDAVLESWDWKCASARAQLSQLSVTPVFGPLFAYPLPTTPYCLKVREMWPYVANYRIEGRNLLTDVDSTVNPVYIRYTARVTDPTQLDNLLAKVISHKLAAEICYALVREKGLAERIAMEYEDLLEVARAKDQASGKDHNSEPGWWQNGSLYDPWGNYAGLDGERLIDNADNWVNSGSFIMST